MTNGARYWPYGVVLLLGGFVLHEHEEGGFGAIWRVYIAMVETNEAV